MSVMPDIWIGELGIDSIKLLFAITNILVDINDPII